MISINDSYDMKTFFVYKSNIAITINFRIKAQPFNYANIKIRNLRLGF